jgi:hypothetical protein
MQDGVFFFSFSIKFATINRLSVSCIGENDGRKGKPSSGLGCDFGKEGLALRSEQVGSILRAPGSGSAEKIGRRSFASRKEY